MGASLAVLLGLVVLASPWSAAGARVPCSGVCSTGDGGEHFDFGLVRFNADGSRDPSFADAAAATTSLQTGSSRDRAQARAVLIQPDGKIVVAGDARRGPSDQLVLARYSVDGSVDPSFGEGGQVITELGHEHDASAQAAVRLPDDGTVVAGSAGSNFALVRYRPDGSLDSSFGRSGLVTTDFGGRDRADALALQPDGRIVVAGRAGPGMALARYRPDGSLDASFGTGGRVVIQGRSKATDVLLQPDGKIVVLERSCVPGGAASRLSRFSRDGSPDLTFGRQGTARVPLGRDGCAEAAALWRDGKILVAGESYGGARANRDVALVRLNPNGTLDRSFGHRGEAVTHQPASERAKAVLVRRDGKIVVVGTARMLGSRFPELGISGYNPGGSLDRSFGSHGHPVSVPGKAAAAALERHGKVVVSGGSSARGRALRPQGGRIDGNGSSPSRLKAASVVRKRHGRHSRGAPHAVPAWFINAHNFRELKRFVATDTCAFARRQPGGPRRTLILDLGGARAYHDGTYGAAVNHASFRARNSQIRAALKVAADAYATCHRRGRVRIAYANNNHFESKRSAHRAHLIGLHQARTMRHLGWYQRRRGYHRAERPGVAGDIEMSWWGPSRSKAMVNGAKSIGHRGYVDFGTAGGCPPRPQGVRARHCFNGWSLGDVAHVSNAHGGRPLPEVYYRGGPRHFNQAAEWASVARAWNARHGSHYRFLGATGSTEFGRLSPRESWRRLRTKTPGHVRRELVNFKQDH